MRLVSLVLSRLGIVCELIESYMMFVFYGGALRRMSSKKVDVKIPTPQSVEVENTRVADFTWGVATTVYMLIGDVSRGEGRASVMKFLEER